MNILVDGAAEEAAAADADDALGVLAALNERLRAGGRAIVEVAVDGQGVSFAELAGRLSGAPLSAIGRIELRTTNLQQLVDEALAELEGSISELPTACHQLAAVFQGEFPDEGFEPFQRLAGIWEHIKERQLQIASALEMHLGEKLLHGKTLEAHHEDLNRFLIEAAEAMEKRDTVLLGDLLEYELAPRASLEAEIVALLKEHAAGRPG